MLFVSQRTLLFDLFIYAFAIGRKLSNLVDSTLQTSTHEGAILISFNFSGLHLTCLEIRFNLDEVSGNFKVSFREIYFQFMFLLQNLGGQQFIEAQTRAYGFYLCFVRLSWIDSFNRQVVQIHNLLSNKNTLFHLVSGVMSCASLLKSAKLNVRLEELFLEPSS